MKNKKKIIFWTLLLLAFILSQWLSVKLVYARKLPDNAALVLAKIYRLKAGYMENGNDRLNLYIKDYIENKVFIDQFVGQQLEKQAADPTIFVDELPKGQELDDLLWHKISKDAWLRKISKDNDIAITQKDIEDYFESAGGLESLKNDIKEYGVSFDQYKKLVIDSFILEMKVHQYLLENYRDTRGVARIQEAYTLLEGAEGRNFDEVALSYSDDLPYAQEVSWIEDSELVDFFEPIRELEPGEFSKVVQLPIGYIIWHLDSVRQEGEQKLWGVKGLFVAAQGIEDFFEAYLNQAKLQRIY
ncbi:MAG: hypothetical protein PHO91_00760 [Patescibacteria group bacterium]|nr:hypothetical protein [Patescibacteria group bacterium]